MTDTTIADVNARVTRPTSSMPAIAGGSVAAAVCAVAIFHGNNVLLHFGFIPIPTEIAAEYQIIFSWVGAIVGHRLNCRKD